MKKIIMYRGGDTTKKVVHVTVSDTEEIRATLPLRASFQSYVWTGFQQALSSYVTFLKYVKKTKNDFLNMKYLSVMI